MTCIHARHTPATWGYAGGSPPEDWCEMDLVGCEDCAEYEDAEEARADAELRKYEASREGD